MQRQKTMVAIVHLTYYCLEQVPYWAHNPNVFQKERERETPERKLQWVHFSQSTLLPSLNQIKNEFSFFNETLPKKRTQNPIHYDDSCCDQCDPY